METTNNMQQTLTEVVEKQTVRPKVRVYRFTGKENHLISLAEGSVMTREYRETADRDAMKGGFFARNIFEKILAQDGCVGIRNYFAEHNDGTPAVVLVGVDENGNDLSRGWLGEDMLPFNGSTNILNSDLGDLLVPTANQGEIFNGKENHVITLAEAKNFVQNYRKNLAEGDVKGVYYSRAIYEKILAQDGCVGIRYYFAVGSEGKRTVVLVGTDSHGNDIVNGAIGNRGPFCPPFCGIGDSAL